MTHQWLLRSASFALALVPGTLFVGGGARMIEQHEILTRAVPVAAAVHTVDVAVHRDVHSITQVSERFWPVVRYTYAFEGRSYSSDTVLPLHGSGTREWAQRHAAKFRPDTATTAWVAPGNPHRAFLVFELDSSPLLLVLLGVPLAWLWLFVRTRLAHQWSPHQRIDLGATQLQATQPHTAFECREHDGPSRQCLRAATACAVWLAAIAFCTIYGLPHHDTIDGGVVMCFLAVALLGVPTVVWFVRAVSRFSQRHDATLELRRLAVATTEAMPPEAQQLEVRLNPGFRKNPQQRQSNGNWFVLHCERTSRTGGGVHPITLHRELLWTAQCGLRLTGSEAWLQGGMAWPGGMPSSTTARATLPRIDWEAEWSSARESPTTLRPHGIQARFRLHVCSEIPSDPPV